MIVDVTKLAYDWLFVSIMVRDVSFLLFFRYIYLSRLSHRYFLLSYCFTPSPLPPPSCVTTRYINLNDSHLFRPSFGPESSPAEFTIHNRIVIRLKLGWTFVRRGRWGGVFQYIFHMKVGQQKIFSQGQKKREIKIPLCRLWIRIFWNIDPLKPWGGQASR